MVILSSSDSNGTLVSLNNKNGLKRSSSLDFLQAHPSNQAHEFLPTALLLPLDEFMDDAADDESFYSCSTNEGRKSAASFHRDCIYLPASNSLSADECLRCLPTIMETCDDLLCQNTTHYTKDSRTRILYVGQQEVAHAVPLQCDVLMTDKATTCHILVLRSFSTAAAVPLVSLAHIDGTHYDKCIRNMVQRHLHHHHMDDSSVFVQQEDEKKEVQEGDENNFMELDVHILGGFLDTNGESRSISNWLLRLLADIASEERCSRMATTLQTCAISSMNDNGRGAPIGRGLGINLRTGSVFLASCDLEAAGPDLLLRSLRLWHCDDHEPRLEVIHDGVELNMIKVSPFSFLPFPDIDFLLSISDCELLQITSTSPDCEDEDFCPGMRQTLLFLRDTPPEAMFGPERNRTRYFKRLGFSNTWKGLHA